MEFLVPTQREKKLSGAVEVIGCGIVILIFTCRSGKVVQSGTPRI
jgi:hypothetical protein